MGEWNLNFLTRLVFKYNSNKYYSFAAWWIFKSFLEGYIDRSPLFLIVITTQSAIWRLIYYGCRIDTWIHYVMYYKWLRQKFSQQQSLSHRFSFDINSLFKYFRKYRDIYSSHITSQTRLNHTVLSRLSPTRDVLSKRAKK